MTNQITVNIPDDISEQVRQIADENQQSLEDILIEHLRTLTLPEDIQSELDALKHLSDDALWTIAQEQMPQKVQRRADELMTRNNQGSITEEELIELEKLAERADSLMLRKAEAASILQKRGYIFRQGDFKPHE